MNEAEVELDGVKRFELEKLRDPSDARKINKLFTVYTSSGREATLVFIWSSPWRPVGEIWPFNDLSPAL